jgi:pilus assembly protein Flp/PilA
MARLSQLIRTARDERGQGLTEYALIIALVAVAIVGLLGGLGDQIGATFTSITASLAGA